MMAGKIRKPQGKVCPKCRKKKLLEEFYGETHPYCQDCTREYERNKYKPLYKKNKKPKNHNWLTIQEVFDAIKLHFPTQYFTRKELFQKLEKGSLYSVYLHLERLFQLNWIIKEKIGKWNRYKLIKEKENDMK